MKSGLSFCPQWYAIFPFNIFMHICRTEEMITFTPENRLNVYAMNFKKYILCLMTFSFLFLPALRGESVENDLYPTPQRIFHIARSLNRNVVCYDANLADGKLNTGKPLNVYWLNREDQKGKTNGLNFIQRKLVYGYKVVRKGEETSTVILSAYAGRELEICRQGTHYVCRTTIDGKAALLKYIYVKVNDRNSLKVDYVELHGETLASGKQVAERIQN